MKMYLISDSEDTRIGMRLAGVDGVVVDNVDEFKAELARVAENREYGVVIVTNSLAEQAKETVEEIKFNRPLPLIIEVPGKDGSTRNSDSITRYIREAIGLNI